MSDLPATEVKSSLTDQDSGAPPTDVLSSQALSAMTLQPAWKVRDLIAYLIFAPLSFLLVQAVAWFGYGLLRSRLGLNLPAELVFRSAYVVLGLQTVFHLLQFGFIYLLLVGGYRRPFWASLGLRRPTRRVVMISLLFGAGMAVAVRFAPALLPDKDTFPLQDLFTSPGATLAIATFAVTLAPFMEELIFRGFIFAILERTCGVATAVVSSAALFALSHVPEYWGAWNHVLLVSLVGLTLSLTRARTGSLAPSIIMHTAYNLVLVTILYFETDGFQNLAVALGK